MEKIVLPDKFYVDPQRHDWERKRNGVLFCKHCRRSVNYVDKIHNIYCSKERLFLIKTIEETTQLLNTPPETQYGYRSNISFKKKDWKAWVKSLQKGLKLIDNLIPVS